MGGGRRVVLAEVPIENYKIGYFVVADETDCVIGKIVLSGYLKNITAQFIPSMDFLYVDATCRISKVVPRFNIEEDDWFGKLVNYASNYVIFKAVKIPVLRSLSEEIGFIYISGNCNFITAWFKATSTLSNIQLSEISVESRLSTKKPRKNARKI